MAEKTIAEEALKASEEKEEKKAAETSGSKYKPGVYRSEKFLRIIKALTYQHKKDANGQVQRTYGTWATKDNVIVFQKGVEKRLSAEDVELQAIQRLIDSKVIYRVGD